MEMVLTGNMITAQQAESDGLVCRVVPNEDVSTAPKWVIVYYCTEDSVF
jgi:enoyl-CoA hydratase/carnithine racemase